MPPVRTRLTRTLVLALAVLITSVASTATASAAESSKHRDPYGAQRLLDALGKNVPDVIAGWWVDITTDQLVVNVVGPRSAVTDAVTRILDPDSVRIEANSPPARPLYNLVGGQKIQTTGGYCSIGFSARNASGTVFVVTAGHCTVELPGTWSGYNGVTIGPAAGKNFPTTDYGSIQRTNTAWTPTALVQGGPTVHGSTAAAVGAQVCRSGATSGYHCGVIQAKNQTVNYGGGDIVYGLTRTNACAEPGDSGGTFVTPAGQAQGMTSGGSGNCSSGGTTFFQPVVPALQAYGLTLVTA